LVVATPLADTLLGMKLLRCWIFALSLGSIALLQNAAAATPDSPADVTKALYKSAMAHPGFTPETIKANRPFLTPDLYVSLWKKVNQPVPKGDAPDIEGDVFLDAQDFPNKFEVGKSAIDGTKAKVEVILIWSQEKRHYTVLLSQVKGEWKVSDVVYEKDGSLTDLLK